MALNSFQLQIDELHSYHGEVVQIRRFYSLLTNLIFPHLSLFLARSLAVINVKRQLMIESRWKMRRNLSRVTSSRAFAWLTTFLSNEYAHCRAHSGSTEIRKPSSVYLATHLVSSFRQFIANDSFLSLTQLIRLRIYSFYVQPWKIRGKKSFYGNDYVRIAHTSPKKMLCPSTIDGGRTFQPSSIPIQQKCREQVNPGQTGKSHHANIDAINELKQMEPNWAWWLILKELIFGCAGQRNGRWHSTISVWCRLPINVANVINSTWHMYWIPLNISHVLSAPSAWVHTYTSAPHRNRAIRTRLCENGAENRYFILVTLFTLTASIAAGRI